MDLRRWCEKAEELSARMSEEKFNMKSGLEYSKDDIDRLSKEIGEHSLLFLKNFKEPRILVSDCMGEVADSESLPPHLKLISIRNQKVRSSKHKFNGKYVTWNGLDPFLQSIPDAKTRKEVSDEFLSKVPLLTPHVSEFMTKGKEVFGRYGTSVLDNYLEDEEVSLKGLKRLIKDVGKESSKLFKGRLVEFEEIVGKPLEYYDSYSLIHALLFKDLNQRVKVDPVKAVVKTLKDMGLDATKVKVDGEYRENKIPIAWCFSIRVPDDVRIGYMRTAPLRDLEVVFHEFGHGIHFSTIKSDLPYWTRYMVSMGIAETFSTLLEGLTNKRDYLGQHVSEQVAEEIENGYRLLKTLSTTSLCVKALTKIGFWERGLTMEETDKLYGELCGKYLGLEVPEKSWQLNGIMTDYLLYMPSYLIAEVRAAELESLLTDSAGEKWWEEEKAGGVLRGFMSAGADMDTSFSKLDPKPFLKRLKDF